MTDHGTKTALVVGATGLVGSECTQRLAAHPDFSSVTAVTRRAISDATPTASLRHVVVDFDHLGESPELFAVSHVFCALGTTIRKAGSRERFRQVDFGYPAQIARLAKAAGARHFLLVSSVGANTASSGFYLRVKGQLEELVLSLGFVSVTIARPSLLLGERNEFRFGESLAAQFSGVFPRRYQPVHGRDVARVLVEAGMENRRGVRVIENSEIAERARNAGVAA